MNSDIMDTYKTSDILLAAVLRLEGYDLTTIELNGNRGVFVFGNIPNELIDTYDLGNMRVEPTAFNNMVKQLTTSVKRQLD